MVKSIEGIVQGRVQGVAFRAYLRSAARHYGISGWVRNLKGGDVAFRAQGEERPLSEFIRAAYQGSPLSSVSSIDFCEVDAEDGLKEFQIVFS